MAQTQVADKPVLMNLPELEAQTIGEAELIGDGLKQKPRKTHPAAFKPGKPPGPGRPKGVPNKLTIGLKEAVELAVQPGQCHPQGFAGWLVERAHGGIEDRKIFAGVVSRVIPLQVEKKTDSTIRIELGWLQGRNVGRHLASGAGHVPQVIDIKAELPSGPVIKDQDAPGRGGADGADQAGTDGTA